MFGAAAASSQQQPPYNPNKDAEITSPPTDGISSLCWSPRSSHLIATSWDGSVYCWEVQANGQSVPKAAISHGQPLLCSAWMPDGTAVFAGGCDKMVKKWDLASNQSTQVAAHDLAVRCCAYIPEISLLVTGSWDKTLRYWDTRQGKPALTYQLAERCYAMDVRHPLLVCATADRNLLVFNLQNPQVPYKTQQSPLKWQTRTVACFPDRAGYLIGSVEGRVAVHHVEDSVGNTKNFTFKCHREASDIYSVNCVAFHPEHGTFVTAGSDGCYNFWDKDSKQRLKAMAKCSYGQVPAPIPCGAFNSNGSIFSYAVSYDWGRGYADYNPAVMKNTILLHSTNEQEVKARAKPVSTGRK